MFIQNKQNYNIAFCEAGIMAWLITQTPWGGSTFDPIPGNTQTPANWTDCHLGEVTQLSEIRLSDSCSQAWRVMQHNPQILNTKEGYVL